MWIVAFRKYDSLKLLREHEESVQIARQRNRRVISRAATMAGNTDSSYQRPRIVVTGVGIVSPVGIGKNAFWQSLSNGVCGIRQSQRVKIAQHSPLGAEVSEFDPLEHIYQKKFIKVMPREVQLGVASASMAMKDAGIEKGDIDPYRIGVEFGASHISTTAEDLMDAARGLKQVVDPKFFANRFGGENMDQIGPLWLIKQLPNMPACHVAMEHDARGPNNTITSSESSAILALAEAVRIIERGAADVMIVGACSSHFNPVEWTRVSTYETLSPESDPERACRPFDRDRSGTVMGEGAGAFVIERYEHAIARGATIYGEILGVGAGCDGSGEENHRQGVGLVRAIEHALRRAELTPNHLGHINAHGKGTIKDDATESRAYHNALGSVAERIPVTAMKSYFGHFDAGAGAVELVGSILAVRHRLIPHTLHYKTPDPECRLKIVRDEPRRMTSDIALSVNRTRMGQSAAAIFRAI